MSGMILVAHRLNSVLIQSGLNITALKGREVELEDVYRLLASARWPNIDV